MGCCPEISGSNDREMPKLDGSGSWGSNGDIDGSISTITLDVEKDDGGEFLGMEVECDDDDDDDDAKAEAHDVDLESSTGGLLENKVEMRFINFFRGLMVSSLKSGDSCELFKVSLLGNNADIRRFSFDAEG